MKKQMLTMLIALAVLFGGIFIWKGIKGLMLKHFFASQQNPTFTVSTAKVTASIWQSELTAVGSLRATLGVNVTAQLGGMIQKIYFTPGAIVRENTLLVQQNADPDIGQLHSLEANAELARITYERDKKQYAAQAISKQQLDTDYQNLQSARAQVAQQAATVAKLTIRAPFTGRLGISNVNPGQFLNPGDTVVTLQSLDPIYADFYLPQQTLAQLKVKQLVFLKTDTFPNKTFKGIITTINPLVDTNTRNVEVEATIANPKYELTPGMYATVTVQTGMPKSLLTVPQSAVSFNSYGDIVYVVKETKDKNNQTLLIANQVFVTTGATRGEQIAVLRGLKAGDVIVTSGQLKLKNGSRIAINNSVSPSNNPAPVVSNEHAGAY